MLSKERAAFERAELSLTVPALLRVDHVRRYKKHVLRGYYATVDHVRLGWRHTEKAFFSYKRKHTCDFCNKKHSADFAQEDLWYNFLHTERKHGKAFCNTVVPSLTSSRLHGVAYTPKVYKHSGWTRKFFYHNQPISFMGVRANPVVVPVYIRACTLCFIGWKLAQSKDVKDSGIHCLCSYHHPKATSMAKRIEKKAENFLPLLAGLRLFSRKPEVEGPMDQYVKRRKQ